MAAELLTKAKDEKESAAALKAKYYKTMDDYSQAVDKIDAATKQAQSILDQMNSQSLVLAQVRQKKFFIRKWQLHTGRERIMFLLW